MLENIQNLNGFFGLAGTGLTGLGAGGLGAGGVLNVSGVGAICGGGGNGRPDGL